MSRKSIDITSYKDCDDREIVEEICRIRETDSELAGHLVEHLLRKYDNVLRNVFRRYIDHVRYKEFDKQYAEYYSALYEQLAKPRTQRWTDPVTGDVLEPDPLAWTRFCTYLRKERPFIAWLITVGDKFAMRHLSIDPDRNEAEEDVEDAGRLKIALSNDQSVFENLTDASESRSPFRNEVWNVLEKNLGPDCFAALKYFFVFGMTQKEIGQRIWPDVGKERQRQRFGACKRTALGIFYDETDKQSLRFTREQDLLLKDYIMNSRESEEKVAKRFATRHPNFPHDLNETEEELVQRRLELLKSALKQLEIYWR